MSNASESIEADRPDPRSMRRADLVIAVLLVGIAIAAFVASADFPTARLGNDVGAARFPRIYAVVLIILGGLLALQAWRREVPKTAPVRDGSKSLFRVATGMGICIASFVLMQYVGFVPAALVQLVALMTLMGRKNIVLSALISAGLTAVVYFLFVYGLHVPLPVGSLLE